MDTLKLAAVSAGLGSPSSTRLLADRLTGATAGRLTGDGAERQVEVRVIELRDLASDIAHHLVTGFPAGDLKEALGTVADADGVIAVTPVFSASYSGLFKSFFDVLEQDALAGKPVLVAATGGSARHSLVPDQLMRPLFAYLRALVVPTAVFAASEDWGAAAGPGAEGLPGRVERAAGELAGLLLRTAGSPGTAPGQPREDTGIGGTDAGAGPGSPRTAPDLEVVPFEEQLAALRTR